MCESEVVGGVRIEPRRTASHPWSRPASPRRTEATYERPPGVSIVQGSRPRYRHDAQTVTAVVPALASASAGQVALAMGCSRNLVCGIADRARRAGVEVVRMQRATAAGRVREVPVSVPVPKPVARLARPRGPVVRTAPVPVVPACAVHATGVRLVEVIEGQCRTLDDAGECCCRPTLGRGSWCASHAAVYVAPSRPRAA